MSLKITDERAVLLKDANGAYSDTDKALWCAALGASDIGVVFPDNSGGAVLVATFPDGKIYPSTVISGFGASITAHLRGGLERIIDYADNTPLPVYLVDFLEVPNSPH